MHCKRLFMSRPCKSSEEGGQQLNIFKACAMLSSDACSSVAYGLVQMFCVSLTCSAAAIWYSCPMSALLCILQFSQSLSTRQIIHAYPSGGGAYVVSSENLGKNAGSLAGASLQLYTMQSVSVSVSAGAVAILSAIPALYGHQVSISLFIIFILMGKYLRGK